MSIFGPMEMKCKIRLFAHVRCQIQAKVDCKSAQKKLEMYIKWVRNWISVFIQSSLHKV